MSKKFLVQTQEANGNDNVQRKGFDYEESDDEGSGSGEWDFQLVYKCPPSEERKYRCIEGCPCHLCRDTTGSAIQAGESSCMYKQQYLRDYISVMMPKLCKCPCNGDVFNQECEEIKEKSFTSENCNNQSYSMMYEDNGETGLPEWRKHEEDVMAVYPVPCSEGCPCELCEDLSKRKDMNINTPAWFAIPGETFRNLVFNCLT